MSELAGGADTGIQADSGQSFESQAPATSAPAYSAPAPSSEPRISQPSQPAQPSRNPQGQFVGQNQPQQPAQFQGTPGGQFAGQSRGVLEAFRAAGYDVSGHADDASFLNAMNGRLTQSEQYEKQIADYQRQLATRGQPLPGQFDRVQEHLAAPIETKNGWNPPAYDPRNDQFFRRDEQSGRWVPAVPNVPYELVEAKNAYQEYREAFAKEWSNNPVETIWNRIRDLAREDNRSEMRNLFQQMQVTKDTNDWLTKNAKVLFVDGQVDHTGDPEKLTQAGHLALQAADELDKAGVQDPAARRQFTERYMTAEMSKQYFQEQAAQQADPSQRKYTIQEISQAIRMAQGLPPQQAAPQPPMQPDLQQQFQPAPPQAAFMPQQMAGMESQPTFQPPVQPWVMTPQGWVPNPQFQPQQQLQFAQQPFVPQKAYPWQQQMPPMTPEQVNQDQKRRFLGGVGHSSSAGQGGGSSGEFVPQPSSDGRPNFLGIANQIAASRGVPL